MKLDIADELARPDLTTQIASKIAEAIAYYQSERFYFSESRDTTFNTVAGQEFYTASDSAAIPLLQAFDYLILYIGSIPWPLPRRTDVEMEVLNQNGLVQGQPWNWSYYNRQLRLGPIPDTAYSVRIAAHMQVAAPASDATTGNVWMTDAESMIRHYAKYLLYQDVVRAYDHAKEMRAMTEEQFDMLKGKTNKLLGRGLVEAMQF